MLPVSRVELPNSICKVATSEHLGCPVRNDVTPALVRLYRRWGQGGSGMIITGNVMVQRHALEAPRNVVVDRSTNMESLEEWARATKMCGSVAVVQLSHPGRQSPISASLERPLAPSESTLMLSGVGVQLHRRPRAMTSDEIDAVCDAFGEAAGLCARAGFDGCQVHAAHGYLLSQFLSPVGNLRRDAYGGREGRLKPLLTAVKRARTAMGAGKIVAAKLNASDFERGGFDVAECERVLRALEGLVDFVEISAGGTYAAGMACLGDDEDFASSCSKVAFLDVVEKLAKKTSYPLVATGNVTTAEKALDALSRGLLVGVGRLACVEPDFCKKWIAGQQVVVRKPWTSARGVPSKSLRRMLVPGLRYGWYQRQLARLAAGKESADLWHAPYLLFILPRALFFEPARHRRLLLRLFVFALPLASSAMITKSFYSKW